jgi:hypothetical protein
LKQYVLFLNSTTFKRVAGAKTNFYVFKTFQQIQISVLSVIAPKGYLEHICTLEVRKEFFLFK